MSATEAVLDREENVPIGILTGMPAWGKVMSDSDLWKITAFVKNINQLPPAVEQQRKQALGASD